MDPLVSIAIDGPAAAGKSTIARRLAADLGYLYIDTGALYRAVGLYAVEQQVDPRDPSGVAGLLPAIHLEILHQDGSQHVRLNGRDVSEEIRRPDLSMAASGVSAIGAVRQFLLDRQRAFARSRNVVMDGRDIGTVVLPDATVKFFLTASAEERARRRVLEYRQKGETLDYDRVLSEIRQRDYEDTHRAIAPLVEASDAIRVDNTDLTLEETVQVLKKRIGERLSCIGSMF